jgi:two-component system sensor histidine kinase KdpD
LKVEKEWLPLDEVIGSALRRVETLIRGHEVRLNIPPELPLVPMDGLLVEQVLVNLLGNAAQYSPRDSSVEVSACVTPEGMEVAVADRGPGLNEEDRGRVFELFYRGTVKAGDRSRGVGLGLAICRAIVRAHGGRIWADSREGGGTSLRFVLPVKGVPPSLDGLDVQGDSTHA